MSKTQRTPLMRQYHQIKEKYPDTILLFRLGDFYETFEDDASVTARVCGITLTKRNNGAEGETPLAGFPYHQLDNYLPKLIKAGYRVAVCEQLEDPKLARGIVRRDVIEIVTPGVAMNDKLLDAGRNTYLAALHWGRENVGIAFCDVSTGEFSATEIAVEDVKELMESIAPAEVIISRAQKDTADQLRLSSEPRLTKLDEWIFDAEYASERLREHFGTQSLKGFGLDDMKSGITAAGAVLHYLMETQRTKLAHIGRITRYTHGDYIALDSATKRNLEILFSGSDGERHGSLLSVIDRTSTPMGRRLLKRWLVRPLKSVEQIQKRLAAVEYFYNEPALGAETEKMLRLVSDLERLVARVATNRATPRDVGFIRSTLDIIPRIVKLLEGTGSPTLTTIARSLSYPEELMTMLAQALPDEPPATLSDAGAIRTGYNVELDELRDVLAGGKSYIERIQERERKRTGISSLKVGFNNVFGYYIEVTHANRDRVPEDYHRKQTMTNAERYITPELKEYEEKVLNAEEKISALERELFAGIQSATAQHSETMLRNAQLLAMLDCFVGFARAAIEHGYVKPEIEESTRLSIIAGRHPVVEHTLPAGDRFVPNDTELDTKRQQVAIITGPNMAGKSCYLRQTGLIVLLAQTGSFVPASRAVIGIVDKIFTRVGAQDNLAAGESTFLVEMHEAANILNNATERSLILLDEVGRGTSTFDGISIAWAIAEYLHESIGARTLFATHYHELNALADRFSRIKNFKVEVREHDDRVIFLRSVTPGTADHSYGIQVAQMAGLPQSVTERAKQIMVHLEGGAGHDLNLGEQEMRIPAPQVMDSMQGSLFATPQPEPDPRITALMERLNNLDLNNMTPLQALIELQNLRKIIG